MRLNGFDERFFVYFEELDFSRRMKLAGWRSVYLAGVSALHVGGGASRQVKAHRLFYSLRSRLLYGFKHFPTAKAWTLFVLTLVLEPFCRCAQALGRLSLTDVQNTLRAFVLLYSSVPQILRQRKEGADVYAMSEK